MIMTSLITASLLSRLSGKFKQPPALLRLCCSSLRSKFERNKYNEQQVVSIHACFLQRDYIIDFSHLSIYAEKWKAYSVYAYKKVTKLNEKQKPE